MRYALLATLAAAGTIVTSAASAMPLSNLSVQSDEAIQEVHLVCNEWGRCWRTGPRRAYRYYGPSYSYGPSYGYYRPYRPYGYYGYGAPSVGFSFRF